MDEKTLKIAGTVFNFANTNIGGSVSVLYIFKNHNKGDWDIKDAFTLLEKYAIL